MSLESSITALAQAIGADIKALHSAGVHPVGTVYTGLQSPGAQWLQAGGVYPSADYPDLYAALGLAPTGAWQPVHVYTQQSARGRSIAYGNGVFVAVAKGTDEAETSPDGLSWTRRELPVSGDWVAVIFGRGLFWTVAKGTDVVLTSPDGNTWTQGVLPVSADWEVGVYGMGVTMGRPTSIPAPVFASGAGDAVVHWNGAWQKGPAPLPILGRWSALVFGAGVNVAVLADTDVVLRSPNAGSPWTQYAMPQPASWSSIAYGNGMFVAVAYGSNLAATSPDGITWSAQTLPMTESWGCVVFGAGLFVAFAGSESSSTVAATSPDGITWTQRTMPVPMSWHAAAYKEGLFVVVAGGDPVFGPRNSVAAIPVATSAFTLPQPRQVDLPYKQWVKAA